MSGAVPCKAEAPKRFVSPMFAVGVRLDDDRPAARCGSVRPRRPVRSLKSGLGRASDFCWRRRMLLYGLADTQCCFDALD